MPFGCDCRNCGTCRLSRDVRTARLANTQKTKSPFFTDVLSRLFITCLMFDLFTGDKPCSLSGLILLSLL